MTATMEAPAPAAVQPKVKPGKVWYWIFGLLTLLSLIAAGAIWLTGHISVENDVKAFARFIAPNEAQLRFKRDGQYVIYYEYAGKIDDTEVDAASTPPDGLQLEMRDAQGQSLDLRQPPKPLSYDVGGYSGVALRQVRIDQPGEYALSAGPPSLSAFAIAVGRGDPPTADSWNQTAILVGAIGAGLGILGLIGTSVLRRRHRRAQADRQTAAVLAAPLASASSVGWAAPADAGPVGGAPPPPGFVIPPPPPPSAPAVVVPGGVVPPPIPSAAVASTPPPPPPPGATPASSFEPIAPPPVPMAEPAAVEPIDGPVAPEPAMAPALPDPLAASPAIPAPPEPSEPPEPPGGASSGWAPPAAGSGTEPAGREAPPAAPPPPPP